jgi:probable HAF family extracellular repeat protein
VRRAALACLLAACGADEVVPGEPDATPGIDAIPIDANEPSRWRVTIVPPLAPDVFMVPLGMSYTTGKIAGYGGGGAWDPVSRPIQVGRNAFAEALTVPEPNYGFAWGAGSPLIVGEHAWQPQLWYGDQRVPLPVPEGWFSGSAHAVNDAGLVVGSWADYDDALPPNPVGPRACAWNVPVSTDVIVLPPLDEAAALGAAFAVNEAGVIAGWAASATGVHAVRWPSVASAPVPIAIEGATLAEARAISPGGDVVGRASFAGGVSRAWIDRAGGDGVELLPTLPDAPAYAEAFDVDDVGHVVGTAAAGDGEAHAVVWFDGEIIDLNDAATLLPEGVAYLSSALGIDRERRIAAEAVMESGTGDSIRYVAILEPLW